MATFVQDRTTPPTLHSFGPLYLETPSSRRLGNGLSLHYIADRDSEVCRISVAIPGGSAEETPDGVMRIIAPALSEGTGRHSGAELAALLEDYGAWSGATLSTHHTVFSLSCLSRYLGVMLPVIKEILLEPSFDAEAMRGLTDRLASRNEVDRCKVGWMASEAIHPLIYGAESPLSVSPTPDKIRRVTPERLKEVHAARLDPRNTHVFISGGIDEGLIQKVADTFGSFGAGCDFPLHSLLFPEIDSREQVVTDMPDSLQSALVMALPVIGRDDPDFVPLRTVIIALGGYFGSRLMLNIREEKGLTYGIGSSLLGYERKGFLSISTQTATEYVGEVERETIREIERLKDPSTYTADELYRLGFFIRSGLASALDTALSRMELSQSYLLAGAAPGYFESQDEFARNLSADVLAGIAAKYLDTSRLVVSIAGKGDAIPAS